MVVLDTSALIYWTLDPDKLSYAAAAEVEKAGRIIISPISIWELGIKQEKGKISIPLTLEKYVKRLQQVQGVEILAVDADIWLRNLKLDWGHRDLADRTIVATAMKFDAPLITSDKIIRQYYAKTVW